MNYSILPQSLPPQPKSGLLAYLNHTDDPGTKKYEKPDTHSEKAPSYSVIPLPEVILKLREEERVKIGEELHDSVNPLLCIAKLFLDSMKPESESDIQFKNEARDVLLLAIENIRYIAAELEISQRPNSSLVDLVPRLVERINKLDRFKILLQMKNKTCIAKIEEDQKVALYRIIQEQLNNTLKYSKAKNVFVTLSLSKKLIALSIKDDGIGFDTSRQHAGVGLLNIAKTVKLFRGVLKITSVPSKGCSLNVLLPL